MLGYDIWGNDKFLYSKTSCSEMDILYFINRDLLDYSCRNYVYDRTDNLQVNIFLDYSSVELEDDNGTIVKKVCFEKFADALDFVIGKPDYEKWYTYGKSIKLCSLDNKDIPITKDGALQIEAEKQDYVRKLILGCKRTIDGFEQSSVSGDITKNVKEEIQSGTENMKMLEM